MFYLFKGSPPVSSSAFTSGKKLMCIENFCTLVKMKVYNVYILKCSDNTYYTGMTSGLELRIKKHETSFYKNSYTSFRLPIELVFFCEFQNVNEAIKKEKQIKKWSKAKKEALINGEFSELINLAKKKFE